MIDIQNENLLTMAQAAASLPNRPHLSTLWRWRKRGIGAVRLEVITIGGRVFTSAEALARFAEKTTAAAEGEPAPSRTGKQRQRAIEQAEKTLAEAGIS